MDDLIKDIVAIIGDYHHDLGSDFQMNDAHVLGWVNQFDVMDREFILTELLHLLTQDIYVSKKKAKQILLDFIKKACSYFGYDNIEVFLRDTAFLELQPKGKSQDLLLALLDEVLQENYQVSLNITATISQKQIIYLDDVLATGKTFRLNMKTYFSENDNLAKLKEKKIKFLAYFLCLHSWGLNNVRYSLKKDMNDDLFMNKASFKVAGKFIIENNITEIGQKLNLLYPQHNSDKFDEYLESLNFDDKKRAYRNDNQPLAEEFFTTPQNRERLETIFMQKGIEIIKMIQENKLRLNHRPLGKTYPTYRTFGTGTMFFTWRNISNTCPIVLWWDNIAHNWKGLFPLNKRGII